MFRLEDDDDKLFALVPIVVLERLQVEKVPASHCSEIAGDQPVTCIMRNCGTSAAKSQNLKKLLAEAQLFHITYANIDNKRKTISKTSAKDTNVSEMKRGLKRSKVTSQSSSYIQRCPKRSRRVEKGLCDDERPYKCSICPERFHTNTLLAVHKRIHDQEFSNVDDPEINVVDDAQQTGDSLEYRSFRDSLFTHTPVTIQNGLSLHETSFNCNTGNRTAPRTQREISKYAKYSTAKPCEAKQKKTSKETANKFLCCKECPATFSRPWYLQLHMILLHFVNGENTSIECPGCSSFWEKEDHLRKHVEKEHAMDLKVMNVEITSSLRVPTDALTGEHLKMSKKRELSARKYSMSHDNSLRNIGCDWRNATPLERYMIVDLVEAELTHIVSQRNKMGDHFTFADIQRLALEITESLHVSGFQNGSPSKKWAQRVLMRVKQIPRPGKFRFVHNVNESYLSATLDLSTRGLAESMVYYACEVKLCNLQQSVIVRRLKTPVGPCSPQSSTEDSVLTILCMNATGSVLLYPTFVFQGQIVDHKSILSVKPLTQQFVGEFFEMSYFREWFAQFLLSIPPSRPVLLLVEGDVSQLSYSIIVMARDNDVHIVFLPSRKRYIHPHQLIRESLAIPLIETFDQKLTSFMEAHKTNSLYLQHFGSVFDSAWELALQKADISESFVQAGFLPFPETIQPLEEASRDYLNGILSARRNVSGIDSSQTSEKTSVLPVVTNQCTLSEFPSPSLEEKVKLEPIEYSISQTESGLSQMDLNMKPENDHDAAPISPLLNEVKYENYESTDDLQDDDEDDNSMCPICDMEFAGEDLLLKHKCSSSLQQTDECDLHTCHICKMSFALKDTLKYHMTMHGKNRQVILQGSDSGQLHTGAISQKLNSTSLSHFSLRSPSSAQAQTRMRAQHMEKGPSKRSFKVGRSAVAPGVTSKVHKQVSFELLQKGSTSPSSSTSSASSNSSRTLTASSPEMQKQEGPTSPASSSSRTLTASSSVMSSNKQRDKYYEQAEQSLKVKVSRDCPGQQKHFSKYRLLPPPPLPEHDYLGQIYLKPNHGEPIAMIYTQSFYSEGRKQINFKSIASPVKVADNLARRHTLSALPSRKQTKKVVRREQLMKAVRVRKQML